MGREKVMVKVLNWRSMNKEFQEDKSEAKRQKEPQ